MNMDSLVLIDRFVEQKPGQIRFNDTESSNFLSLTELGLGG